MQKFPPNIRDFASQFAILQARRHKADYDPSVILTRYGVITLIDAADAAITKLRNSDIKDQRAFAVWTVMNHRTN